MNRLSISLAAIVLSEHAAALNINLPSNLRGAAPPSTTSTSSTPLNGTGTSLTLGDGSTPLNEYGFVMTHDSATGYLNSR